MDGPRGGRSGRRALDEPWVYNRRVDLKQPCHRHDFGYGNAKKMGAWGYSVKRYIDGMFLQDMCHVRLRIAAPVVVPPRARTFTSNLSCEVVSNFGT